MLYTAVGGGVKKELAVCKQRESVLWLCCHWCKEPRGAKNRSV